MTKVAEEAITNFDAGAIRNGNTFLYPAAPSGTSEVALFKVNLKSGVISHTDLDRSDHVAVLFSYNKRTYAVFYDSTLGTRGLYKINNKTGATKLVLDLASLPGDPVPGAFARQKDDLFLLFRDNSDTYLRHIFRFTFNEKGTKAKGKAKLIKTSANAPVTCDKIKSYPLNDSGTAKFFCVASPVSGGVTPCSLNRGGIAKCEDAIPDIERAGFGHTLVTDGRLFYFFGYAHGETSQRLIQVKKNLKIFGTPQLSTQSLIVNARIGKDDEPEDLPIKP